jgi:hypothetical protein
VPPDGATLTSGRSGAAPLKAHTLRSALATAQRSEIAPYFRMATSSSRRRTPSSSNEGVIKITRACWSQHYPVDEFRAGVVRGFRISMTRSSPEVCQSGWLKPLGHWAAVGLYWAFRDS